MATRVTYLFGAGASCGYVYIQDPAADETFIESLQQRFQFDNPAVDFWK